MNTLPIALYPSPHGFGHLTRLLNVAILLVKHNTKQRHKSHVKHKYKFYVRTSIHIEDGHLLRTLSEHGITISPPTTELQPRAIQLNPYTMSPEQTRKEILAFDLDKAMAEEAKFIRTHAIQLAISDCPSIPCAQGIPAILLTNFTFDTILEALMQPCIRDGEAHGLASPDRHAEDATIRTVIRQLTRQYQRASLYIRLPGYIDTHYAGRIVDIPMHFRKATLSKHDTLESLRLAKRIRADAKVLLHCFGGQPHTDAYATVPMLPEGWICLSQTMDAPPFFYRLPRDVHMPNLIAASDAVLGKLGWGMCSEVIGNGYRPFIYVPREAFIEEQGLLRWMEEEGGRLVRLAVERYESMDWKDAILEAARLGERMVPAVNWMANEEQVSTIVAAEIQNLVVV